jgi:S-methyl-5-thioribose kinase
VVRLDDRNLLPYLERRGVLEGTAGARVEPAGRGNLNFVRRVRTARGASWVVKQARPGVEGFPDFPLTSERIVFESRYFETVKALVPERAALLPAVRCFDPEERVLVLEDLGEEPSLDALLREGRAPLEALRELGAFLAEVHTASARCARPLTRDFANDEMRGMNGAQMFAAPYPQAAPPLPPALAAAREAALSDRELRGRIAALAERYARAREALVQGDAKPRNAIVQDGRPRLFDAEFAHVGDPAFDLGVALGHVVLAGGAAPAQNALLEGYRCSGGETRVARGLRYAGAVVLAHLIGPSRQAFEPRGDDLATFERGRDLLLRHDD